MMYWDTVFFCLKIIKDLMSPYLSMNFNHKKQVSEEKFQVKYFLKI